MLHGVGVRVPLSAQRSLFEGLLFRCPFGANKCKLIVYHRFAKVVRNLFGKNRNVVKMRLTDENGYPMDGVYFGNGDEFAEEGRGKRKISIVYYPDINMYQGRESLQVIIRHYQFD